MIEETPTKHVNQETEIHTDVAERQAEADRLYDDMHANFLTPL